MNQVVKTPGDRLPLLITIVVFVLMLACLPLVLRMDDSLDRVQPMYKDMLRMQNLQNAEIAGGGQPIEAKLTEGQTVEVGGLEFETSPGVSLVVRATDTASFCIRVSNDDGEKSAERCGP